ncbi:hypothetical protein BH23PLA1_BH23PLA1_14490 [soil metagenome]
MRHHLPAWTLAAILGGAGFSQAQDARPGPGDSPARGMMTAFERNAPKVGQPVPDITVLDARGNPISLLEQLQGEYSVLVFGCLT